MSQLHTLKCYPDAKAVIDKISAKYGASVPHVIDALAALYESTEPDQRDKVYVERQAILGITDDATDKAASAS